MDFDIEKFSEDEDVQKKESQKKRKIEAKKIHLKNKMNQKIFLSFPRGRSIKIGPREDFYLEEHEFTSSYFNNRKKFFQIIGGQ